MARRPNEVYIHILTDQAFDEANREAKGALKKRAIRALQARCNGTYIVEVGSNLAADLIFKILRIGDGSKSWMLRKVGDRNYAS